VVEVNDPEAAGDLAEVRKSGLNIMMSMRAEGKPVSVVEDCAVELKDLADYTAGLTEVFEKHGSRGTWYAHASVGCLHVRPVLNLKLDTDVKKLRAIAEEAFELVRKYKGSHSGEHGDGIVRSEFNEVMFGAAHDGQLPAGEAHLRPRRRVQPGQGGRCAEDGRPLAVPLQAGLHGEAV
jgi:FAD/FMN-containing dehydrogenase